MTTQAVFLAAASATAGALVAATTLTFFPAQPAVTAEQLAEIHSRLDGIAQGTEARQRVRRDLDDSLEVLTERLEQLEGRVSRQPVPARADGSTGSAEPTDAAAPLSAGAAGAPDSAALSGEEFKGLLTKVMRNSMQGTATAEEQERFWQAARTTDLVAETITALEASVEQNPRHEEARMELADAYVAKLLTVPAGPERGIWGMRAEEQWKAVVEQNPDHWDAQYTLAFNYSMYPDFLNKTQDAIDGFERALAIQQRVAPHPQHTKTYVQLARMHGKNGDDAKAREVLETGQMRHPDDEDIRKALAALPGK